jgi:hypothetical protein
MLSQAGMQTSGAQNLTIEGCFAALQAPSTAHERQPGSTTEARVPPPVVVSQSETFTLLVTTSTACLCLQGQKHRSEGAIDATKGAGHPLDS